MSQFGRQSGDSDGSPGPRTRTGASRSPSWQDVSPRVSPVSHLQDSPSSYGGGYGWDDGEQASDLERDTASSSGIWRQRSRSPSVFQSEGAKRRRSKAKELDALGEAAGCLVSGIYFVSTSRHGKVRDRREDEISMTPPRDRSLNGGPGMTPLFDQVHQPDMPWQPPPLDTNSRLEPVQVSEEMGQSDAQEVVCWEVAQTSLPQCSQQLEGPEDQTQTDSDCDFDSLPTGVFVLETPAKYQIGRPPCMFGRSHVNILAHPDRFRFWFDHRSALSPLAFALCSHAASGYRNLQLNQLFLAGSDASHRSCLPGFMVLTGRWNKCPDADDHEDWQMDSPPHRSEPHALEACPWGARS